MLAVLDGQQGLTSSEKFVLLVLARHADADGSSCYPSQRRIAAETALTDRTVRSVLRRLEEKGYITRYATTVPNHNDLYLLDVERLRAEGQAGLEQLEISAERGRLEHAERMRERRKARRRQRDSDTRSPEVGAPSQASRGVSNVTRSDHVAEMASARGGNDFRHVPEMASGVAETGSARDGSGFLLPSIHPPSTDQSHLPGNQPVRARPNFPNQDGELSSTTMPGAGAAAGIGGDLPEHTRALAERRKAAGYGRGTPMHLGQDDTIETAV